MNTRKERLEKRRKEKQKEKTKSLMITGGVILAVVGLIYFINATTNKLIVVEPNEFPEGVIVDGTSIGDPNAVAVIEVYEDFLCGACRSFNLGSGLGDSSLKEQILKNIVYTGEARFIFRHYPFLSPDSTVAAEASMCANDQGKFWDFHDMLFENQRTGNYTNSRLRGMGEIIGLDDQAFNACLKSDTHAATIDAEFEVARGNGVGQTPTILVNGIQVEANLGAIQAAVQAASIAPAE